MVNRRNRYFFIGLFLFFPTYVWSLTNTVKGEFKVSPLGRSTVDSTAVRSGLEILFHDAIHCGDALKQSCMSSAEISRKANQVADFLHGMSERVNRVKSLPFVEKHSISGSMKKIDFSFPSLMHQPGSDKSNMVHGMYIYPRHGRDGLEKFRTLVIFHASSVTILQNEWDLAK